jgi:SPW repeat-containing protein
MEVIAMSDTSTTRAWTRWQDWAEVVLGVVAVLSPLWLTTTNTITWTLIVLGALIVLDGLFSLAMPGVVLGEYVQVVLGILLFISPWVMGFTDVNGAMWSAFIIGALTAIAGAVALPAANAAHTGMAGQH